MLAGRYMGSEDFLKVLPEGGEFTGFLGVGVGVGVETVGGLLRLVV